MIGNLIKNIIIPEKIGTYYLLSQRILGFSINKATVHATQLLMHGTNISLERFLVESIPADASIPYAERVSQTLKKIVAQKEALTTINGWSMMLDIGTYGTNYLMRALITLMGIGAVDTTDLQRENNSAFVSGVLFGLAGGALIGLVTELVLPFYEREKRQ